MNNKLTNWWFQDVFQTNGQQHAECQITDIQSVVVVGWIVGWLKYMATTGLYIHKSLTITAKNRLVHTWILHKFHQDFPDWITQDNTRIFWIY